MKFILSQVGGSTLIKEIYWTNQWTKCNKKEKQCDEIRKMTKDDCILFTCYQKWKKKVYQENEYIEQITKNATRIKIKKNDNR